MELKLVMTAEEINVYAKEHELCFPLEEVIVRGVCYHKILVESASIPEAGDGFCDDSRNFYKVTIYSLSRSKFLLDAVFMVRKSYRELDGDGKIVHSYGGEDPIYKAKEYLRS